MSNGEIRVGIIGCGMITQRSQAPGLAKTEGVEITALCDTDAENRAKVREEHAPDAAEFEDYVKKYCRGSALVTNSEIVKGIATAMFWFKKPDTETRVFTDMDEAMAWARSKLEA